MTDADLAQVCKDLYDAPEGAEGVITIQGIVFTLRRIGDVIVVCFRGSETIGDWVDDLNAVPIITREIGIVHKGFFDGMREVAAYILPKLKGENFISTGHSLGGARARDFAGLALVAGLRPARLVTFGSPRPAFANLRRIIEKSGIEHVSYRNRNDPVPLLPFETPFVPTFEHTEAWIAVDSAPDAHDFEMLRDHHIDLYIEGVKRLETITA